MGHYQALHLKIHTAFLLTDQEIFLWPRLLKLCAMGLCLVRLFMLQYTIAMMQGLLLFTHLKKRTYITPKFTRIKQLRC